MSKTYTIQEVMLAIEKEWIRDYGKLSYCDEAPYSGYGVRDFVRLALINFPEPVIESIKDEY